MTVRRVELIGYTPGCNITVEWDGSQVFAGDVGASGTAQECSPLAEWTTEDSVIGSIPLRITCGSGSLYFAEVRMNLTGADWAWELAGHEHWPGYVPDLDTYLSDMATLINEQLLSKYALDRVQMRDQASRILLESNQDYIRCSHYRDVDPAVSDGKDNVKIDSVPQQRHDVEQYRGSWHYYIGFGQTLECDIRVDAAVLD